MHESHRLWDSPAGARQPFGDGQECVVGYRQKDDRVGRRLKAAD
jgi:hypothetical protein